MSAYPSLPLFTDAFIADTGHLSAQETGAYLMLMMVAWRSPDCRLADDDDRLARWARVDRRTWLRIKPVVLEFWTLADGFWTQKRLSKERDVVSKRAEVARENGKHGGRPKSLSDNDLPNPVGSARVSELKPPISSPKVVELPQDPNGSLAPSRPKRVSTARNHALPDDWSPGRLSIDTADELGRDRTWMLGTAQDMRFWALGNGITRTNWDMVHAGWMRREAKREAGNGGPRAPPGQRISGGTALALRKMEARCSGDPHGPTLDLDPDPFPSRGSAGPSLSDAGEGEADDGRPFGGAAGTVHDFWRRRSYG